jgi:hypothetical protein
MLRGPKVQKLYVERAKTFKNCMLRGPKRSKIEVVAPKEEEEEGEEEGIVTLCR